jgi:hypothetical protein
VDPPDDWDAELDRLVAESVLTKLSDSHRAVQPYGLSAQCTDDQGSRFYLGQF